METDFIYWRYETSIGVRVEQLSGCEDKSPKLWKLLALQVFGEHNGERYREVGHFASGAPFIQDSTQRISISHTPHFMVIASLPRTPEAHLDEFSVRTAMGIDAEMADRRQACDVIGRVTSDEEKALMADYITTLTHPTAYRRPIPKEKAEVETAVLTWTIKEALYKAALEEGIDAAHSLRILRMPEVSNNPLVKTPVYGEAQLLRKDTPAPIPMRIYSYRSEGHIITIVVSTKCATFKKS